MHNVLIVDDDREYRDQMAEILIGAGYNVTATGSVSNAIYGILKRIALVVVLGTKCEEMAAADLVPLLKRCNPKLNIILVAADISLGLLRKLRCEGIFYHSLRPVDGAGREEVCRVVRCAFENLRLHPA